MIHIWLNITVIFFSCRIDLLIFDRELFDNPSIISYFQCIIINTLLIGVVQKINIIYQFKCPLRGFISENSNIYVGLTLTTLSRRVT